MSYNADGIKEMALLNKKKLKQKYFKIPSAGMEYKFKISGVGARSIKIEKYFFYSEIIKVVSKGMEQGFEFEIEQVIVDPSKKKKPVLESSNELRERALVNKSNLKKQYINAFVGKKEYGFRISGVGYKSIKIELYVGYDDIVKELSAGNDITLEFILLEILMDNEVDYSKFNKLYDEDELIFNDEEESEEDEEIISEADIKDIKKLSADEFDEIFVNVSGWQKLVFDAIEDILEDTFTMEVLLNQDRIRSYQSPGENLENKVSDNLNQLIDLGLVSKVNKTTYVKLW